MTTTISGDTWIDKVQPGTITQDDLAANVAGKGPAFSAQRTVAQGLALGAYVLVQLDGETYDTNNFFDAISNYRFQPLIAGYYQTVFSVAFNGTGLSTVAIGIFKNGVQYTATSVPGAVGTDIFLNTGDLIYCNGSTDYIDFRGYVANGSGVNFAANLTKASGFLARAA